MLLWQRMALPHNGRSITCDLRKAFSNFKDFVARIYETNPRAATGNDLERRLDICTIFVAAMWRAILGKTQPEGRDRPREHADKRNMLEPVPFGHKLQHGAD
jgi:hypothetical protein